MTPVPATPTVLRTLDAAILLDRRGDGELVQESRGAPVEWGGVYAQQVRLTGPWRLRIEAADGVHALPGTASTATVDGERYRSAHALPGLHVEQEVVPLSGPPGALRTLRLTSTADATRSVLVTSIFEPYLLPVMVEGIRPVGLLLETRPRELRVRQRGFGLALRTSLPPDRLYVDRASWRGGRRRGPVEEVGSEYALTLPAGGTADLRLALVGGLERELDRAPVRTEGDLPAPGPVAAGLAAEEEAWSRQRPTMRLPEDPALERAYGQAIRALRRLYSRPSEDLTGLVAGYPWYGAIWCRDLAWMLPAVLWLGDAEWARASVDSVFRLQATHEVGLVGAEPGELPMQISPGPVFLFGTSDTTLHYPALAERYLRHTGASRLPDGWWEAVVRAIAWGEARTDPQTGLLRNGGEVARLEQASAAVARIRYGIDAMDTTIWDSTDRRDHAIDVQVLWLQALRSGEALATAPAAAEMRERWAGRADRLSGAVTERYPWPAEGYLFDSLNADGPVRRIRPNALRAVSAGIVAGELARTVVRRAERDDLATPWGLRTLASTDPGYSPTAYHDGQVWTIATAWAADAAFAVGDGEQGLAHLHTIAERYAAEGGGAHECYRGDRPEPFDSCFLLGFSVAPFLTVLFERLWGIEVDARVPRLTVRPSFPAGWRSASLEGLRLGEGTAAIRWDAGRLEVSWNGGPPLEVVGPAGDVVVRPGTTASLGVAARDSRRA